MNNKNKRKVKIVALAVAAFFALGIVGMALTQTQSGYASVKNSAIGSIDWGRAMQSHPDMAAIQAELQREGESLQRDFDEKSKNMNDQERQNYFTQLDQRMQQKQISLFTPLREKMLEAVRKVATAKGLAIVVSNEIVVFGGTDITDDVIKAFGR